MANNTQVRQITVAVKGEGIATLRELAYRLGDVNKSTKELSKNANLLADTFKGWLAYLGVRELTTMADEMSRLQSGLAVVTGSAENAAQAFSLIRDIAQETRQSIADIGTTFTRFSIAMRQSGASVEGVAAVTETLTKTFIIAQASQAEVAGTMRQLTQVFSSGILRGQELNSVMEQNGVLAAMLSKRYGRDLREEAKKGAITVVELLKILRDNVDQINQDFTKVAPTFEQSITVLRNSLTIYIGDIANSVKASSIFNQAILLMANNLDTLAVIFGSIVVPIVVKGFAAMTAAAVAFVAANPIIAGLTAIAAAAVYTYNNTEQVRISFERLLISVYKLTLYLPYLANNLLETFSGKSVKAIDDMVKMVTQWEKQNDIARAKLDKKAGDKYTKSIKEQYDELIKQQEKMLASTATLDERLAALNKQYLAGSIGLEEYAEKLRQWDIDKINNEMEKGKKNILDFNEALNKVNIERINTQFKNGSITIEEFNNQINGIKAQDLQDKLESGRISLIEYNKELVKTNDTLSKGTIIAGTASYIESIGTLSSNVADGIRNTFGALETMFSNFIKTGKFNFRDFAQSVLDDLNKIITRALIIKPFADAILGGLTSGITSGGGPTGSSGTGAPSVGPSYPLAYAAYGATFDRVNKFAKGGVVDSPTMFKYGGGIKTGVMGEAGPEAILPLARGSDGRLGVASQGASVNINIINQSGANVEQSESTGPNGEKQIDILIRNTVRSGINNGSFDKDFKNNYGMVRKGV